MTASRPHTNPFAGVSRPYPDAALRLISLGAGVQSSVMALMAAAGEIGPMPDAAIFADTGWEPRAIYGHLDWLEKQLPFPVFRVSAGNLRDDLVAGVNTTGQAFASIPAYTLSARGDKGMVRRQCTREYKIEPIVRKTRELLGLKKRERAKGRFAETWIGISRDEIQRLKASGTPVQVNRFPLIELGMTRRDCLEWFNARFPDRTLVRSACLGCPYKTNTEWRALRDGPAEEWDDAVQTDRLIRSRRAMNDQVFLHRDCVPLGEADLSTEFERGQMSLLDECDGMCGV